MNDSAFQRGAPGDTAAIDRQLLGHEMVADSRMHVGCMAITRNPAEKFALTLEQKGMISLAQPRRRLDERIEHALQIEPRAAYNLEQVGGGGLLLQRFAEVIRALTQLIEQPRILDRDDGMFGEGLQQ